MLKGFYELLIAIGNALQPVFLLGVRLFWGWQFFNTGKTKLLDIAPVAEFFKTLELPFPTANAYLVGGVECLGGLCLLLGFASRLVAIPLMIAMSVAIVVAHQMTPEGIFNDPLTFVQQLPFTFLLASVIVFAFGPGLFSIDGALKRLFRNSN